MIMRKGAMDNALIKAEYDNTVCVMKVLCIFLYTIVTLYFNYYTVSLILNVVIEDAISSDSVIYIRGSLLLVCRVPSPRIRGGNVHSKCLQITSITPGKTEKT